MHERGVFVDHCTVHRWSLKILPILSLAIRPLKHPVGTNWRMDEACILVAGQWKYLYRDVDKTVDTVDFLLTAKWYLAAARRYLERAIFYLHGLPEKITLDKSRANTTAIKSANAHACLDIALRQFKYLNNIVAQEHRAVKRITDPMPGFKSFWSAQKLIDAIETMHMVKKGQLRCPDRKPMSAADQLYGLAFLISHAQCRSI
jgi:putative transposase